MVVEGDDTTCRKEEYAQREIIAFVYGGVGDSWGPFGCASRLEKLKILTQSDILRSHFIENVAESLDVFCGRDRAGASEDIPAGEEQILQGHRERQGSVSPDPPGAPLLLDQPVDVPNLAMIHVPNRRPVHALINQPRSNPHPNPFPIHYQPLRSNVEEPVKRKRGRFRKSCFLFLFFFFGLNLDFSFDASIQAEIFSASISS